jgi:hypothetical protein
MEATMTVERPQRCPQKRSKRTFLETAGAGVWRGTPGQRWCPDSGDVEVSENVTDTRVSLRPVRDEGEIGSRTDMRSPLRYPFATIRTHILDEGHHEAELVHVLAADTAVAEDRLLASWMATHRCDVIHENTLRRGRIVRPAKRRVPRILRGTGPFRPEASVKSGDVR